MFDQVGNPEDRFSHDEAQINQVFMSLVSNVNLQSKLIKEETLIRCICSFLRNDVHKCGPGYGKTFYGTCSDQWHSSACTHTQSDQQRWGQLLLKVIITITLQFLHYHYNYHYTLFGNVIITITITLAMLSLPLHFTFGYSYLNWSCSNKITTFYI